MSFNEGVSSDSGRVRSAGRTGGMVAGVDLTGLLGDQTSNVGVQQTADGQDLSHCKTGADANKYTECRMVTTADSLDVVWATQLAQQNTGVQYQMPDFQIFEGQTSTGCGQATSAVGPFYCPTDRTVYLDIGFFDQIETQFGGENGPLAQEYVIAHEWGHHIQNLEGVFNTYNTQQQGDQGGGVRSELQADCYAGVWMYWASHTKDPESGQAFLKTPTQQQVAEAMATAEAIGDDRIQERFQGGANPHTWTHGSGDQRQKWLMQGLANGDIAKCDTWNVRTV